MKIFIFYNYKNLCILHGQVFVMFSFLLGTETRGISQLFTFSAIPFLFKNNKFNRIFIISNATIHVMSLKVASGRFFFHFREVFEKCINYRKILGSFQGGFEIFFKKGGIFDKF